MSIFQAYINWVKSELQVAFPGKFDCLLQFFDNRGRTPVVTNEPTCIDLNGEIIWPQVVWAAYQMGYSAGLKEDGVWDLGYRSGYAGGYREGLGKTPVERIEIPPETPCGICGRALKDHTIDDHLACAQKQRELRPRGER